MTHILHVEDSKMAYTAVMKLFREKDLEYAVDWAATVSEGMKMLGERQYDLMVLDYSLPDGTGIDLIEKAKDTPVVFFTGQGNEKVAVQAMKQGAYDYAYDYVAKDLDGEYLEILPAVIERALQAVRLKREKEEAEAKLREQLDITERFNKLLVQSNLELHKVKEENERLKKKTFE